MVGLEDEAVLEGGCGYAARTYYTTISETIHALAFVNFQVNPMPSS